MNISKYSRERRNSQIIQETDKLIMEQKLNFENMTQKSNGMDNFRIKEKSSNNKDILQNLKQKKINITNEIANNT